MSGWQELWQQSFTKIYHSSEPGIIETIVEYPQEMAKGYRRFIRLRSGIILEINDYVCENDFALELVLYKHWCTEFVFSISRDSLRCDGHHLVSGENYLATGGYSQGRSIFRAKERCLEVNIYIDFSIAKAFFDGQIEVLPKDLRLIVEDNYEQPYLPSQKTTSAMQLALQQILNCPYQGLTKQMYLESKALELVALQLQPMIMVNQTLQKQRELKSDDIDCINQAKVILLQNLHNPPSLLALARQVRLNERKLKEGFRQVFGTTVFGYLHNYRMEQARSLLAEKLMSITAVAHAVGYKNLGDFSTAFRKKFGISPKAYQKLM